MSTYYAILELGEHATAEEIRQAYRRLVLLTHPDRTPDPAAHERYLAINAAYEVLSQPARRALYDALLAAQRHRAQPAAPPPHPDPALRRRSRGAGTVRGRPGPRAPAPADPYAAIYARYVPRARWFCRLLLVLCGLLLLDAYWTLEYPNEPVQYSARRVLSRRSGIATYYTYRTPHTHFRSYEHDWPLGTRLTVRRSALFRQIRAVGPVGGRLERANEASIYGNFSFVPLLLALLAAVGSWRRTSNATVLNCAVAGVCVLTLLGYFLYNA